MLMNARMRECRTLEARLYFRIVFMGGQNVNVVLKRLEEVWKLRQVGGLELDHLVMTFIYCDHLRVRFVLGKERSSKNILAVRVLSNKNTPNLFGSKEWEEGYPTLPPMTSPRKDR